MSEPEHVKHTIAPVYDSNSKILILGTIPSPKSRVYGFYYGNPQNRFWRVLSLVQNQPLPKNNEEKQVFLLKNKIALWDVLQSCDITGADDGSIRRAIPNDIAGLLAQTGIRAVFTTGTKAAALYQKLCQPQTGLPAIALPSTSPANCRFYTLDSLVQAYRAILPFISPAVN